MGCVNFATKSAQHAHARMITTVLEKVHSNHLCDRGFMDVINTPIVSQSVNQENLLKESQTAEELH